MTIYFTASIAGKKQYLHQYLAIIDHLKARGFDVIADHIISATESKIRLETKEERLAFHRKLEQWIKSCDVMVVEASFPSISVGYEISLAIRRGKPVLILYTDGDPPSLFGTSGDEKVICERYTEETLGETLDAFIGYVQGAADTRFTFFITSDIAAHLDKVSMQKKIPKSVYLRQLIETDMRRSSSSKSAPDASR